MMLLQMMTQAVCMMWGLGMQQTLRLLLLLLPVVVLAGRVGQVAPPGCSLAAVVAAVVV
jgi:hypothetical protein